MNLFLQTLFLFVVFNVQNIDSVCSHYKHCFACAGKRNWNWFPCYWCPLSNTCHSKLSLKNHCLQKQNIRKTEQCVSYFHGKNHHYSPPEAFRLAQFSAIAYSDEPKECMAKMFRDNEYVMEKAIIKQCDDYFFDYDKQCSAIVAKSDTRREIIVAIRGTRGGKQVLDQVLTVVTKHTVNFPIGGKVQAYFNNVNTKLYPEIKNCLKEQLSNHPDYEVKVTGHSLGGAVASLTSALLIFEDIVQPDNLLLYTFGMPRVGNKHYANIHDKIVRNSWRIVREGDIITRLPNCFHKTCSLFNGPYHHGTMVLYSTSSMRVESNYILCKGKDDSTWQCKKRQRYKRGLIGNIIDKHRDYFGVPIGTYCINHIVNQ